MSRSTIKPNTRMKEELIKKEAARVLTRKGHKAKLRNLLASIPKIEPSVIPTAVNELINIAEEYKASKPLVDKDGRRHKESLSDARKGLLSVRKHLLKAKDQLSGLTPKAKTSITAVTDGPLGKTTRNLTQIEQSVGMALSNLAAEAAKKPPDLARIQLAYEVAAVFTGILGRKPTCTRAGQLKEANPRGGAAYDRVLRAVLIAAGTTGYDSGKLMKTALKLLTERENF